MLDPSIDFIRRGIVYDEDLDRLISEREDTFNSFLSSSCRIQATNVIVTSGLVTVLGFVQLRSVSRLALPWIARSVTQASYPEDSRGVDLRTLLNTTSPAALIARKALFF
jgi:hypothetical protein